MSVTSKPIVKIDNIFDPSVAADEDCLVHFDTIKMNNKNINEGLAKDSLITYYFGKEKEDLTDKQISYLLTEILHDVIEYEMITGVKMPTYDYKVEKPNNFSAYKIVFQSSVRKQVRRHSGYRPITREVYLFQLVDPNGDVIHEAANIKVKHPAIKKRPLMRYNVGTPHKESHPYFIIQQLIQGVTKSGYTQLYEVVK